MAAESYEAMPDSELKHYFLWHREGKAALRAYLDRLGDRLAISSPQSMTQTSMPKSKLQSNRN